MSMHSYKAVPSHKVYLILRPTFSPGCDYIQKLWKNAVSKQPSTRIIKKTEQFFFVPQSEPLRSKRVKKCILLSNIIFKTYVSCV